jgi:hypothetical protein
VVRVKKSDTLIAYNVENTDIFMEY